MRVPIICASLIAGTVLLPPQFAAGEEPTGMVGSAPVQPNTVVGNSRAHDNPLIPPKPFMNAPPVESPGQPPPAANSEKPRQVSVAAVNEIPVPADQPPIDGRDTHQVEVDEGAFLLPVWERGFWLMPPGGMTRWLIIPPGFINPDETLAAGGSRDQ